jgi:hypothetical protein
MTEAYTPESVTAAILRYLDEEMSGDELRAYLSACDAAIEAGAADRRLSGPVGAAALVLLELEEGVRPPADVRSTLESAVRTLAGESTSRPTPQRNPIPRPKQPKRTGPSVRPDSPARANHPQTKAPRPSPRRGKRGGR